MNAPQPASSIAARLLAAGAAAVLAQVIVAPNIAVAGAVPNIILITVIISAIRLPSGAATVFGFVLGLFADLFAIGPFGLMMLIMTLIAFIVSSLNKGTFTGHWLLEALLVVIAALFVELLYGVVLVLVNPDLDIAASLLPIVLPATLFDALLGLLILLIVKLLGGRGSQGQGMGSFRGEGGPSMRHAKKPSLTRSSRSNLPGRPINRKLR
jgi:rod shape-determining protein MreD